MALTGLANLTATDEEIAAWRSTRNVMSAIVDEIQAQGGCYQCVDQQDGRLFGDQHVLYEDHKVSAVLASDPRSPGHTIVNWRPHRGHFLELDDEETAHLFTVTRRIGVAIEAALEEVERVYLVTMNDGPLNHLHLQLIPRYRGHQVGSLRFIDPRGPVLRGQEIADAIRQALGGQG